MKPIEAEALALARARSAVEAHWVLRRQQGAQVSEEEMTTELLKAAWPELVYQEFNRAEEGRLGADWLWWFVSPSGECFGTLLQAKKIKVHGDRFSVDLGYTIGSTERSQLQTLLHTADMFNVPAGYILYCGDRDFRKGLDCGARHVADGSCDRCDRSAVTVLSGPCAKYLHERSASGAEVFHASRPLEDLGATASNKIYDLNLGSVSNELRSLLLEPQSGARAVAKHLFAQAAEMRIGHLAAATGVLERVPVRAQIFASTPADEGHFGLSYYSHLFRGLRSKLPPDVQPMATGQTLDPGQFPGIAGVTLFTMA